MLIRVTGPKIQIIYTTIEEFCRNDWSHHRDIYIASMIAADASCYVFAELEELLWRLANVNGYAG